MPKYDIVTLEKFETQAHYTVEADTLEEAVGRIVAGDVAYYHHTHTGCDDELIAVLMVDDVDAAEAFEREED